MLVLPSDSYMGVEIMSMRGGGAIAASLIGAVLQALLAVGIARGEENTGGAFSFIQQVKLTEKTKVGENQFGYSVALDEDTALIGVPGDDEKGSAAGAVYVFRRDEKGVWQQMQKLTASNGKASNFFGASVALSGDVALVGARGANPEGSFSGAVYVFVRGSDGVWKEVQVLNADDGKAGNFFGWSVAVYGNTALIGARGNGDEKSFPGAAYVFTQGADGKWAQAQKLTALDGAGGDEFGYSVALLDNTALIGARGKNEKGILTGAAYLFSREVDGQWAQQQKFTASDGASGEEFGYSVALDENTVVVGARFAREEAENLEAEATHPGAVYVYELKTGPEGAVWEETQKLLASEGNSGSEFGGSVALSGDSLLIGAREAVVSSLIMGAAYVFVREQDGEAPASWKERQRILARDGAGGDTFGASVALQGESALIGSPLDDLTVEDDDTNTTRTFTNSGSVYSFSMTDIPAECAVKTDYDDAECSKTFLVASLAELAEYVETDFGREKNNGRYTNLDIIGNLSASFLDLQSPCKITLDPGVTLRGDFVNIDGRRGISGNKLRIVETKKACVVSEQGSVSPGDEAIIEVGELTLRAGEGAIIGDDAIVAVDGALTIETVGDSKANAAVIDSGALVNAGSVQIKSSRAVEIREQSRLNIDGALSLIATQADSRSAAVVGEAVQIQATDLTISSPRKAEIGKNASIKLSGQGELVSENDVVVNKNATINVTGNFRMEAADAGRCKISSSAQITAGATSGNCF